VARAVEEVRRLRPDRVPPHNLEAEESVLGSMMLSPEAIADVVEIVKPTDFYRSAHANLRHAPWDHSRGDPVDPRSRPSRS
jgi:replicative DNA helicase